MGGRNVVRWWPAGAAPPANTSKFAAHRAYSHSFRYARVDCAIEHSIQRGSLVALHQKIASITVKLNKLSSYLRWLQDSPSNAGAPNRIFHNSTPPSTFGTRLA